MEQFPPTNLKSLSCCLNIDVLRNVYADRLLVLRYLLDLYFFFVNVLQNNNENLKQGLFGI